MNRKLNNLVRAIGAGVLAAAACGPAWAQQEGNFDKPLSSGGGKARAAQPGQSYSTVVMRQDDGDNSYEVRVEGDQVTAKVNGKEVPADRVVREKNEIKILGKNGETLTSFHLSTQPGASAGKAPRARGGRLGRTPEAPQPPEAPAAPRMNPPKVMIGINMDKASEDQLKEAGLKEDADAIVIERVIPDLPAEHAGLREGDLITEIDGQTPATQERLREVMQTKKPGDTVKFTVRREGTEKTVRVEVEKYDADKLPMPSTPREGPGLDNKELEDMLKQYGVGGNGGGGGRTWAIPGQGGQQWQLFTPSPKMDEKMADLDKRMADLDARLDKLSEQLSKIEKAIDTMNKQHGKE